MPIRKVDEQLTGFYKLKALDIIIPIYEAFQRIRAECIRNA